LNLYIPIARRNKVKNSFLKYKVDKSNKDLNEKFEYKAKVKCIPLSEIISSFNKDDFQNNGINKIIENFKNIIIDKINNKIIKNGNIKNIMN